MGPANRLIGPVNRYFTESLINAGKSPARAQVMQGGGYHFDLLLNRMADDILMVCAELFSHQAALGKKADAIALHGQIQDPIDILRLESAVLVALDGDGAP